MSQGFRIFVLTLGVGMFGVSYLAERQVFPRLAKWVGTFNQRFRGKEKKRKGYKVVLEDMRVL